MTAPSEMTTIGITEKLNSSLPADVLLTNQSGNTYPVSSIFPKSQPTILTMVYYNCPMLCGLVLDGTSTVVKDLELSVGKDFQLMSVSVDERDTFERAAQYQEKYLAQINHRGNPADWSFYVGEADQVKRFADSVGFGFEFLPDSGEIAHSAALIVLSPEGKVMRYLYGVDFDPFDLKMALLEASEGKSKSALDRVLMYCYNYDPDSRGYVLQAWRIMRIGGFLVVLVLSLFLVKLFIEEKKKKKG